MLVFVGVEQSPTNPNEYIAILPEFPKCKAQGTTPESAIESVKEALKIYIQEVVIHGLPLDVIGVNHIEHMMLSPNVAWSFIEYNGILPDVRSYKSVDEYLAKYKTDVLEVTIDPDELPPEILKQHMEVLKNVAIEAFSNVGLMEHGLIGMGTATRAGHEQMIKERAKHRHEGVVDTTKTRKPN